MNLFFIFITHFSLLSKGKQNKKKKKKKKKYKKKDNIYKIMKRTDR